MPELLNNGILGPFGNNFAILKLDQFTRCRKMRLEQARTKILVSKAIEEVFRNYRFDDPIAKLYIVGTLNACNF